MAEGGFVLKFDGKKVARCYAAVLDYDEWQYAINNKEKQNLPKGVKVITLEVEHYK